MGYKVKSSPSCITISSKDMKVAISQHVPVNFSHHDYCSRFSAKAVVQTLLEASQTRPEHWCRQQERSKLTITAAETMSGSAISSAPGSKVSDVP
jgi:hypothetical protein